MDKFVSPCEPPEGLERELLTILAEECNEVAHRCSKALRFGIKEVQPGQEHSNATRIEHELGDVWAVFEHLARLGVLDRQEVSFAVGRKDVKLAQYLQANKCPKHNGEEK